MRSASVKSAIVFTLGLLVARSMGNAPVATTPFTRPLVFAQRISVLGPPLIAMSTLPESSASLLAPPFVRRVHVVLKSARPAARACFSTSCSFSAMTAGRYDRPGCLAILSSFVSAAAAFDRKNRKRERQQNASLFRRSSEARSARATHHRSLRPLSSPAAVRARLLTQFA